MRGSFIVFVFSSQLSSHKNANTAHMEQNWDAESKGREIKGWGKSQELKKEMKVRRWKREVRRQRGVVCCASICSQASLLFAAV